MHRFLAVLWQFHRGLDCSSGGFAVLVFRGLDDFKKKYRTCGTTWTLSFSLKQHLSFKANLLPQQPTELGRQLACGGAGLLQRQDSIGTLQERPDSGLQLSAGI